jgi:hypothetical protein
MRNTPLTMRGRLAALFATLLCLSAGSALGAESINPHADELLRSMSDYLSNAKAFSVTASVSNEFVTTEGEKLQLNSHSELLVERPAHIRVARRGRFADVELYFDGANLTAHGKTVNAYVQQPLEGTIDDAVFAMERETGLSIPGADLLLSNPYAVLSSGVVSSGYHGRAFVDGVEAHHLSFRTAEVDWQLWVKAGDEPLPVKYVITTKWLTGAPQYSVQLTNWNLTPKIARGQFTFAAPQGAVKLDAFPVDETGEVLVGQEGQ